MQFVHDHNKNEILLGLLKDGFTQADSSTPEKVSTDPTLQAHRHCPLYTHPQLQ